jgi:cytoskeleton protein RodZ
MGSLGETLRQARLDRGVSLTDAEHETRVRRRYLESLENEDYSVLPAQVYTRGYIRTYARYLGLDPEATLDLYSPGRTREERSAIRPATPRLSGGRPVSLQIFLWLAGGLVVVLCGAYLWTQYTYFKESVGGADTITRVPIASAQPVATVSPSPQVPGQPVSLGLPGSPGPASPTPERGIVLELRTTDRTWMEVWVDGTSQLQTTLPAGSTRSFTANSQVRIRVGNAGAVQASVNGESQGALGERNQVKEFVWDR